MCVCVCVCVCAMVRQSIHKFTTKVRFCPIIERRLPEVDTKVYEGSSHHTLMLSYNSSAYLHCNL